MTTWTIDYYAVRDGVLEFEDAITVQADKRPTMTEAYAALAEHHKAQSVNTSQVCVLRITEVTP